jgi:hypothetical protein
MANESSKLFKTRTAKSRPAYGSGVQIDYAPMSKQALQSKVEKNPSPMESSHESGATLAKRPRKQKTVTFGSVTIRGGAVSP